MIHTLRITTSLPGVESEAVYNRLVSLSRFPYAYYEVIVAAGPVFAVEFDGMDALGPDPHGGFSDLLADVDRALNGAYEYSQRVLRSKHDFARDPFCACFGICDC